MKRRSALLLTALPALGFARDSALSMPVWLQLSAALAVAVARGDPLVLLVSLPGCPFCEEVRRNYLLPMHADGLPAWRITVDDKLQRVLDFNGRASSGAALVAQWKVQVTQTVLFFVAKGTEIACFLEGIPADFYGTYLDGANSHAVSDSEVDRRSRPQGRCDPLYP